MKPEDFKPDTRPIKFKTFKTPVPDLSGLGLIIKYLKNFRLKISKLECPKCRKTGHIKRMRSRNRFDRFKKRFFIKTYYCDYCTWKGTLMRTNSSDL